MKRVGQIFVLYLWFFALAMPAQRIIGAHRKVFPAGLWAENQFKYFSSSGGGTGGSSCPTTGAVCTVTVSAVVAGHTLFCFTNIGKTTTATLSSCSGGETWTHCPSCASWNSADGGQDVSYVLSAIGGETSVTCTVSAATGFNSCGVIEEQYSGVSVSFDASGHGSTASCTSCPGQNLTIASSHELIIAFMNPGFNVTAVSSPYNVTAGFTDDYGVAAANNLSSGTGPTWTQTGGTAAVQVAALALKGN